MSRFIASRGPLLVSLLLCGCLIRTSPSVARDRGNCAWRVCVAAEDGPLGRTYVATNEEPVPVTVVLSFRALENLRMPPNRRIERVIPPDSSVVIRLDRVGRGRPSADLAISIDLGSSSTRPDDYVYSVPFGGGVRRPLIQGFGGEGTHLGAMQYSLDFAMPSNTAVVAARDGIVLLVQDGFTEGRADPRLLERANLVVVAHGDGTMASYGHLALGVEVQVGDQVEAGDLLGWSGRTGFAGQPHLHFHVGLRALGEPGRTIPIRLKDGDGRLVELTEGVLVRPARGAPLVRPR